jgi:hypothetical protein
MQRIVVAAVAAFVLTVTPLAFASQSRGATSGTTPSSNVVVIPGFSPPTYAPYYGIPALPTSAPELSTYHFSQLAAGQVTAAALQPYDTAILYGIRWSDLSASAQQVVDQFAETHKVVIWDADDTGSQSYSTFIHPFSTTASGENGHSNDSVVSFPGGNDFLASNDSKSPYYLDPNQLVTDRNMLNDMSAMKTGTSGWTAALVAANKNIPNGGWPVAWAYGNVGDQTGMTIYSGIDADAFEDNLSPNYAVKELALDLAAPFREAPKTGCAPNCPPPPPPPPPPKGGGGSGGGSTYASCVLSPAVPTHWVHGRVTITLKTSVAAGITGKIVVGRRHVLAGTRERHPGLLRMHVHTRRLRSNHATHLHAIVYFHGRRACTRTFRLKVDNRKPRLLRFSHKSLAHANLISLRVSERSSMQVVARHFHRRAVLIAPHRTVLVHLPRRVKRAKLVLRDRAGNVIVRRLRWR